MIESLMVTGRPSSGRPSPECARRRSESAASRAARSSTNVMTAFRAGLSASIRLKNCWVSSAAEISRALSIATSRPAGAKNSSLEKPMGHLGCSGGSTDSLPLSKGRESASPVTECELAQGLFEAVAIQPRDYFASDHYQRAPDQIGFLRHQLEGLLGSQLLVLQAHRLEGGTLRAQKIARVMSLEQVFEFGQIERGSGVVALFKFDLEIIAQETSCVATSSSGRLPDKARLLHVA